MASLNKTYVADDLPQTGNFEPLPEGWYTTKITQADLKTTKAGNGEYIAVHYAIGGRTVFGNINIRNPSIKCEEIGRQQLGYLMRAIGLKKVSDTDELIGADLSIKLKIRPAEGQWEATNDVTGFKALEGKPAVEGAKQPPWASKK